MREKLVCYLLGELDDAQCQALEARLAAEPCLRKELEQIRECLESSSADCVEAELECPDNLASRTADGITKLAESGVHSQRDLATFGQGPSGRPRWTFVDVCVAASVVLAVGAMLMPAINRSRGDARRLACENNMGKIGRALQMFANDHAGHYPFIHPEENAGMFAVRLAESGKMERSELSRLLYCRASSLQDGSSKLLIVVPKDEELRVAKGRALVALRRWMAGSYAYRFGYVDGGYYRPIKNRSDSSYAPILSDAPIRTASGWVSTNHGAKGGQNVLFHDGKVRFLLGARCTMRDDDLFVNRHGQAAAGQGENDAVLARSDLTPDVPSGVVPLVPKALLRDARPVIPPVASH